MTAHLVGAGLLDMDDAGFILGAYAITFAVVGGYAWRVIRHARRLSARVDDEHKYWT